ncbi:MAG TPA: hydrogenase iron-sulfur subunit [Caldisericia bacterium]|nr:hydrogenase iron-sulfur subunit [Caldisericia bacterium]
MDRTNTVIAFVCQADKRKKLISSLKSKYPALRVIPVICIGKLNPVIIFRLLMKEARAVILVGCEPSDCHFREGVFFSERRFFLAKEVLKGFGLNDRLLNIIWSNPGKDALVLKQFETFMQYLKETQIEKGA